MRNKFILPLMVATMIVGLTQTSYATQEDFEYPPTEFTPRVTALYSMNAEMAKAGKEVFYIPKLEELPDIKNTVADVLDYRNQRYRFAAVYDGYFNPAVYEALVRKQDGTYTVTPKAVEKYGGSSLRELNILGYDAMLKSESISNIQVVNGTDVTADYNVESMDNNTDVDLNTALMGVYKAVGKPQYDITYVMARDDSLKLETSPIQKEISGLAEKVNIDTSAGKTYVFSTRTNPALYWKQAVKDGIVYDADVDARGVADKTAMYSGSTSKQNAITLGEFCSFAWNLMHIYGEPVMTDSEKNILLQAYGSSVPYNNATEDQVVAIENMIAKGIISPDDDAEDLSFSSPLKLKYYLTLLMRIKDKDSRKTYKDVKITMDAAMLGKNFYKANVTAETSSIRGFRKAQSAVSVSNYFDYSINLNELKSMAQTLGGNQNMSQDLYISQHLGIKDSDGNIFPLNVQVSTYSRKVYSPDIDGKLNQSTYNAETDGPLVAFGVSDGVRDGRLRLRLVSFNINELLQDGQYQLVLIGTNNQISNRSFYVNPGGGDYESSGTNLTSRNGNADDGLLTEGDSDIEYSNEAYIEDMVQVHDEQGVEAALSYYRDLIRENPDWTDEEKAALRRAATTGQGLSATDTTIYYMTISPGSESRITVKTENGDKTLQDIMTNGTERDGARYATNKPDSMSFVKLSDSVYQVNNCPQSIGDIFKNKSTNDKIYQAFSYQDKELLVSTEWLKSIKAIDSVSENGSLLTITTFANNIYVDKQKKVIVVGSVVYDTKNIGDGDTLLWYKTNSGEFYVNYRAVFGWTGDAMLFKSEGNKVSVNIDPEMTATGRLSIHRGTIAGPNSTFTFSKHPNYPGGYPMTENTILGNWITYVANPTLDQNGNESMEDKDWLFVFKPKTIYYNGKYIEKDDKSARQILQQRLGINVDSIDSNLIVYAYPLYKKEEHYQNGMPEGMTWDQKYGYVYTPENPSSTNDFWSNYFSLNTDTASATSGRPKFALPLLKNGNRVISLNYNSYKITKADGTEEQLPYGQYIVATENNDDDSAGQSSGTNTLYSAEVGGTTGFKRNSQLMSGIKGVQISPAVTSPALWITGLNQVKLDQIPITNNDRDTRIMYGSDLAKKYKDNAGNASLSVGDFKIPFDSIKDINFARVLSTQQYKGVYSSTTFTSFTLDPNAGKGGAAEKMENLATGLLNSKLPNIDWGKYKLDRILEDYDFFMAIAMILILHILPKVMFVLFMVLLMLGMPAIRNARWWQVFCHKYFDVYKLLTFGASNVDSINYIRVFWQSIIAMSICALFMDGNILYIFSWIAQFLAMLANH